MPANFYPVGFIFLVPFFIFLWREQNFWRLIWGAFVFRLIFGLGTAYFTLEPIMWASSLLIFLGLPVSVFLIKKLTNFLSAKHLIPLSNYPLLFSLPFLWTIFDHLEARYSLLPTYIITAGNSLGSSPFLGLAVVGGLTLLSFFAALINVLIATLIFPPSGDPPLAEKIKTSNPKLSILNLAAIFFLILGAWQISNYQIKKNSIYYDNLKNSLSVAVVSVNEKFDFSDSGQVKNELAAQKADLIVFPEDVFNEMGGTASLAFYRGLSEELNTNLVATFETRQNGQRYNSTVLFNAKGEIAGVYNKNRLTFMGEYWPFKNWRPFFYDWLKKSNPGSENYAIFNPQNAYAKGNKKILTLSQKDKIINFASLICLEIHYLRDLKEYKKSGARFIANPTSNRWLSLDTEHFLYLTNNLRKIEAAWLKIPIISSGVKDFAGIITPDGKINFVNYESKDKNYGLLIGEIKY